MYLDKNIQEELRKRGIITENEVASKEGDLYVAINVISKEPRIIQIDDVMLESTHHKKLLKG